MSDPFATLELPRSLTLEAEDIDASWREKTTRGDVESDSLGPVHEARALLADPVNRLEYWLRLSGVEPSRGNSMAPEMMDLFSTLHGVLAETDEVITKMKAATTDLMRAVMTKSTVKAQLRLQECMQTIQQEKANRFDQYPDFEISAEQGEFSGASTALGQLKFLRKWEQQCQERLLSLLEFQS